MVERCLLASWTSGDTDRRRGVATSLSCDNVVAQGSWHRTEVAQGYYGMEKCGVVAWGCESGGTQCYCFSKRSSTVIDVSAYSSVALLIHIMCVPLRNLTVYLYCSRN